MDACQVRALMANTVSALPRYLGLGLPWLIASIYWRIVGPTCEWQEKYPGALKDYPNGGFFVKAGPLVFSVALFSVLAICSFLLLLVRRVTVGGELGGPKNTPIAGAFIGFWCVFVIVASLNFEGVIETF